MSKNIQSFLRKMHNTPHLMTTEEFSLVEALVEAELSNTAEQEASLYCEAEERDIDDLQYNEDTKIGFLPIVGTLVYEDSWWYSTSYQGTLADAKTMLEAGATTLVMDIDSGGGFAYGMMESASLLRRMVDEYGAKLIAYNDGISASAAYGFPCVAHEFITNPDAETGSIGVVVSLMDWSEYDKKNGIKRIYITAGDGKVPYDKDGKFTKEFLEEIQNKVDSTYERFVSHVAQYRDISEEDIKALGAKVYDSGEALEAGLVDKVMTREEFFNYLADEYESKEKEESMAISTIFTKSKTPKKENQSMSHDSPIAEEKLAEVRTAIEAEYAPKLTQLEASLTKAKEEFEATVSAKDVELAALKASLEAFEKEKNDKAAEAEANKQATRIASLKEVFGDVEGEKLAAVYAQLSDDVFKATLEAVSGKAKAAAEELEEEEGDAGEELNLAPKTKEAAMAEHLAKKYGDKPTSPFTR